MFYWLIVYFSQGFSLSAFFGAIGFAFTVITFPGSLLCSLITGCYTWHGDVGKENSFLVGISVLATFIAWYLIVCLIAIIIIPIVNKIENYIQIRFGIRAKTLAIITIISLLFVFFFSALASHYSFWNKISGGKNISLVSKECRNNYLKVKLKNIGYKKVNFSEINIFVENNKIDCDWEGSLKIWSTAICTSKNVIPATGTGSYYPIKVDTPLSSYNSSVACF